MTGRDTAQHRPAGTLRPHLTVTNATPPIRSLRALTVAAAVAALAALALSAPASAMTKCGQQVLNDWWDNTRVDKTYPLHCYREAIKGLPEDLKQYGQAADDIQRDLQAAAVDPSGTGSSPPSPPPPASGTTTDGVATITGDTDTPGGTDTGGTDTTETVVAADRTDTGSPSSVPVPLIVLGGLALLLLALGSAGYISRRSHGRRGDPPPEA
jgi:hypothetical protein